MIRWISEQFKSTSIKRKLTMITMLVTISALLFVSAAFIGFDLGRFHSLMRDELTSMSDILGAHCSAPLLFDDALAANETLAALRIDPRIAAARIYTMDGVPFASYFFSDELLSDIPLEPREDGVYYAGGRFYLFRPVVVDGDRIGTIYLLTNPGEINVRIINYSIIVSICIGGAVLLAMFLSIRLRRVVTDPVTELTATANNISQGKDYSLRARKHSDDELGILVDRFNEMLEQIQARDAELRRIHDELEQRVEERTEELSKEVGERKLAQSELAKAKALLLAAIEHTPAGILIAEAPDMAVSVANSAALGIRGRKSDQLADIPVDLHPNDWQVFHPDGNPFKPEEQPLTKAIRDGKVTQNIEAIIRRQDGEDRWILASAAPVKDADGNIVAGIVIFPDITDRKVAEQALKRANRFQERLLATAATAIFTVDSKLNITSINEAFSQVTGFTEEDVLGKNCSILKGVPCNKFCGLYDPDRNEPIFRKQCTVQDKDGRTLTVLKNATIIHDSDGKPTSGIESFVDVTDMIEAQKATEEANLSLIETNQQLEDAIKYAQEMAKQAQISSTAKSEFLANMSHEIRTPLNGIIGFTQLLAEEELSSDQQEYVETIYKSGTSLLELINDILDFSKIEADKLDLEEIDFNLHSTIENIGDLLGPKAFHKGLELTSYVEPGTPSFLRGDPGRLRQIILNLIGNAIKFTEKGEITLSVRKAEEVADKVMIQFEVSDTGIGIPQSRQEAIFESFTQVDGSTTRKYGGTGLGLTICKRLIDKMNGNITLSSTEGAGSTFTFTLPFEWRPEEQEEPRTARCTELRGMPVLVVDDNDTNRRFLTTILANCYMDARQASSGAVALKMMKKAAAKGEPYRLVFIDGNMPKMDGFELAGKIKSDEDLKRIPLIMLTSSGRRGDASRCRELGIEGYLTKPIKQSILFDTMRMVMGHKKTPKQKTPLVTSHLVRETQRPLKVLLVEDNAVNQRLAVRLMEKRGYRVEVANNGREAVEMHNASTTDAYDLILMDIQMPVMDGIEATSAIRRKEVDGDTHIPIIAMTAHAMKGDREKFLSAGMDAYVSKPFKPKELFEVIERYTVDITEILEVDVTMEN